MLLQCTCTGDEKTPLCGKHTLSSGTCRGSQAGTPDKSSAMAEPGVKVAVVTWSNLQHITELLLQSTDFGRQIMEFKA